MQTTTITIQGPHSDTSCTREVRHARGANGGRIEVRVSRQDKPGVVAILWCWDRGKGWSRMHRATFRGPEAETQALAGAAEKWASMLAWLEKLTPESRAGGAAAAFSAQVASMSR